MRKRSHLSWLVLAVFTMTIFFGSGLTAVAAPGLSDVQGHWAADTIQKMVDAGVVAGQPDGTFKPDNNISRAEFATLVVKAFKLEEKAGKVFTDTSDHWAKAFISTANANGIVSGYSDTEFGPNDPITREQMAVMIVKAAGWKAEGAAKVFPDDASISAWAKEAVSTASAQGVIKGRPDGNFDPKANATRAEAAVVISGTLDVKAAPEKPVDISTLDKAGTYGPASGSQEINGNVTISASGVILQNAVITGDLLIAEGVGSGEATLKNVTVKGTTTIKGGETVNFENCKLGKVNIKKAEGKANVVLSGTTSISELLANSAVKVSGQGTIDKAVVYVANVVIEMKPTAYEVASGITANIGGVAVTGTSGGGGGPTTSSDDSNRVKPVNATPPAGEVPAGTQVTLSTATAGATIYYTLDGSVPSSNSTKYTAPITINAATTIRAIAIKVGQTQSLVASLAYSVSVPEASASVDVAVGSGAMSAFKTITVKSTTGLSGAAKYKVSDGTTTSAVKDLGVSAAYMTSAESVTVTILASDGTTVLGTGTLNVTAAASTSIAITAVQPPVGDKTADCTVAVGSGAMAAFKTITVTSTTVSGGAKYKVSDGTTSSAVKDLGVAAAYMTSAESVTVTILASDGTTVLGTGTLNVTAAASTSIAISGSETPPEPADKKAVCTVAVGSGAMAAFKTITVTSTTVNGAAKYKVSDGTTSSAAKDLGVAAAYMTSAESVTVSILASDGTTVLGTGTLNVASAASDVSIDIQ
ncbi:S-layer homology domain-containing protein [Syntrophomonas wolfei]|uniref:S-layer homology domain-containing protein n=1 Tax=Syntrophomonas wolfei TaxID=863 RepID=UPI000773AF4D|nr:S-layer homology domain-containing protein [Syntrophomonas wolfei]